MIDATLSSSRQSLIAITAFLGVLVVTIAWSINSMVVNSDLQSKFELKSQLMDRMRAQSVIASRNDSSARFLMTDMVIAAPTDTLAASDLHKKILGFLDDAGGSVHSIQAEVTNDVVGEGLRRLNAQTTFDSSVDALQKVLFAMETAVPFVFVDSLVIQPVPTSATSINVGDRLRITLAASSYWKPLAATTLP